jgi:hypothetical protein
VYETLPPIPESEINKPMIESISLDRVRKRVLIFFCGGDISTLGFDENASFDWPSQTMIYKGRRLTMLQIISKSKRLVYCGQPEFETEYDRYVKKVHTRVKKLRGGK